MRYIFIIFLIFAVLSPAYADVVVYRDKKTKEVVFVVPKGERVFLSKEDKSRIEKVVLPGNLKRYNIERPSDYKLVGKKFVLNMDKINKKEIDKNKSESKAKEIKMIKDRALFNACKELEGEGVTFKYVKCSDYK